MPQGNLKSYGPTLKKSSAPKPKKDKKGIKTKRGN